MSTRGGELASPFNRWVVRFPWPGRRNVSSGTQESDARRAGADNGIRPPRRQLGGILRSKLSITSFGLLCYLAGATTSAMIGYSFGATAHQKKKGQCLNPGHFVIKEDIWAPGYALFIDQTSDVCLTMKKE